MALHEGHLAKPLGLPNAGRGSINRISDRDPVRQKTRLGLYAAHPGPVANPLSRCGRLIATVKRGRYLSSSLRRADGEK